MEFLDRESELAVLADHLDRRGAGLFVLYGRRRIGKTELLRRALADRPRAAYHVGTRSTPVEELARLSDTLAREWGQPLLAAQPLASLPALLAFLEGVRGPHCLVLDEFPCMSEGDPSFEGLLQAAWDRSLSRGDLKLVVCGSSVSVMESTFLSPRAPLYGRRTGQLRLGPLPPHALRSAFPGPPERIVEIAATFGGVPAYLQRLDPDLDLEQNLRRHVLARGEPLYEEVPFLLREELREPRVYAAILATIAGGARKFGEISSKVGLDRANLTRYLSVLHDLGLVEREVPVTEALPDRSRKGLYRVSDPFTATWFALVHPFRDQLETGALDRAWPRIRERLAGRMPLAVEPIVRDLLRHVLAERFGFHAAHAGRQWAPGAEFDAVFLDEERRRAFVVEVKWTQGAVGVGALDDLRRRVSGDPALSALRTTCAVVSRAGFRGRAPSSDREYLIGPDRLIGE
ncbi:MAG: ATP-binding protein [Deltaproteobacteria bacterium]|nr:ATP-binding protein [Deltaproteobacteria bacterium]